LQPAKVSPAKRHIFVKRAFVILSAPIKSRKNLHPQCF
jgi:hypothetical protein